MAIKKISHLRNSYEKGALLEKDVSEDPFVQFKKWFNLHLKSDVVEPTAMTLATASKTGRPSARTVLLKGFDLKDGFMFFTNYQSKKGTDLKENPYASLLFYWASTERQIRIEGKVSRDISAKYFQSRPLPSQLGAWSSEQSKVIPNRAFLEQVKAGMESYFKNSKTLPLPPFWGGYMLVPTYFEFWQGRQDRLHDRISYRLHRKKWIMERLAP